MVHGKATLTLSWLCFLLAGLRSVVSFTTTIAHARLGPRAIANLDRGVRKNITSNEWNDLQAQGTSSRRIPSVPFGDSRNRSFTG